LAIAVALLVQSQSQAADNWPRWRGPNGTGVAAPGDYPVKFSANEGLAWKIELPGPGSSSPVVWDDAVFITCETDGQDALYRYGLDNGKQAWQKVLGAGRVGKHRNGTGANPSPATDGKHVVAYFKSGRLGCFDPAGKKLWEKNLQDQYGKDTLWWDLGTSPIIVGKNVVITVMQTGNSYLAAFDLDTGELQWKEKREYVRPVESDQSYSTPQLATVDGGEQIIVWGSDHLTGHDAATGKLAWDAAGFNPDDEKNWRVIASQAVGDGIVVVPFARGPLLGGIKLGGHGDVTKTNWLWKQDQEAGADVPTPIVNGDAVYILADKGKVTCRELKTGQERWSGELPKDKDKYYASPILAGSNLYCVREDGMAYVVKAAPAAAGQSALEVLGKNDMGEHVIATPAAVRNSLLIRCETNLFLIGGDGAKVAATK
jgi:outer membrane protein assembly factor BamB